MPQAMFVWV